MKVVIDKDTGTVTIPHETKRLQGVWDGTFSSDVKLQNKAPLSLSWTDVRTITAAQIEANALIKGTTYFNHEEATAHEWRFKHDSDDLSATTGTLNVEVYNL